MGCKDGLVAEAPLPWLEAVGNQADVLAVGLEIQFTVIGAVVRHAAHGSPRDAHALSRWPDERQRVSGNAELSGTVSARIASVDKPETGDGASQHRDHDQVERVRSPSPDEDLRQDQEPTTQDPDRRDQPRGPPRLAASSLDRQTLHSHRNMPAQELGSTAVRSCGGAHLATHALQRVPLVCAVTH